MPRHAPRREVPTRATSRLVATARARDGAAIELRWAEGIETPNCGFVAHELSAWDAGARVGYLRTGFVPKANLETYLPTVWHHVASFGGSYLGALFDTHFGPAIHPDGLDPEAFAAFRTHACRVIGADDRGWTDYAAMMRALKRHPGLRERETRFAAFRAFHLDRPLVDYVSTRRSEANGVLADNSGRGIGLMLYAGAVQILAGKSLRLHASGLQSDSARRLWSLFAARGWSRLHEGRVVLDPAATPAPDDILAAVAMPHAA